MAETLNIVPSWQSKCDFTQNATVIQFGDGYEQRAPIGLNSKRLSFELVWDQVTTAKAAAVLAFFEARGATEAFLWTPFAPHGAGGPLQFVTRPPVTHTKIAYDCESVRVRIDQDFNPLP